MDDLEIQNGRERYPEKVRRKKPDGQRRIPPDLDHDGGDRKPEKRNFGQGPVRSFQCEEKGTPKHVQDDIAGEKRKDEISSRFVRGAGPRRDAGPRRPKPI